MKNTRKEDVVKLHLGCGTNLAAGWINVDNNYDNNIDLKKLDLNWDLTKPLPYKDNSVDLIFHEHFIEHLKKPAGEQFLRECYRLLKPGGVMRMGWPDLARFVRAYATRDKKYFDYISKNVFYGMKYKTWDELIGDYFYSWDHQYGYTRKHMKMLLKDIGFKDVRYSKYGQSTHNFDIDVRNDPATTYIEAIK